MDFGLVELVLLSDVICSLFARVALTVPDEGELGFGDSIDQVGNGVVRTLRSSINSMDEGKES